GGAGDPTIGGETRGHQPVHPWDYTSLRLRRVNTSLSPVSAEPPTLRFEARLVLDIVNTASLLDVENPDVAAALERALADLFESYVRAAVSKMQAMNADAAGFGAVFRRSRPHWWRAM